jgi:DivIVA domain-containing protein
MHEGHGGHEHPPAGLTETAAVIELPPKADGTGGLLTPADIRNKVFATVRLREGYDLAQVDTFLDQVETTLSSVLRQNAALRARLSDSRPPEAGDRAARIVALTQEAADREIGKAREEALDIVAEAREQAEAVKRDALSYGARVREGLQYQIRQLQHLLAELQEKDRES